MGGWRKTPVALLIISAIDAQGRTLMSAWIETYRSASVRRVCTCRTLMSAWIETRKTLTI